MIVVLHTVPVLKMSDTKVFIDSRHISFGVSNFIDYISPPLNLCESWSWSYQIIVIPPTDEPPKKGLGKKLQSNQLKIVLEQIYVRQSFLSLWHTIFNSFPLSTLQASKHFSEKFNRHHPFYISWRCNVKTFTMFPEKVDECAWPGIVLPTRIFCISF